MVGAVVHFKGTTEIHEDTFGHGPLASTAPGSITSFMNTDRAELLSE